MRHSNVGIIFSVNGGLKEEGECDESNALMDELKVPLSWIRYLTEARAYLLAQVDPCFPDDSICGEV